MTDSHLSPTPWDLERLEAAWANVLEHWNDLDQHNAFVHLADEVNLLDIAAKRYAEERGKRPDDEFVRKMATQIVFRAQFRLRKKDKEDSDGDLEKRVKRLLLVAAIVLIPLILLWVVFSQFGNRLEEMLVTSPTPVAKKLASPTPISAERVFPTPSSEAAPAAEKFAPAPP